MTRRLLLLLPLLLAAGCDTAAYYKQAIGGQLEILSAARPVDAWLADPATPARPVISAAPAAIMTAAIRFQVRSYGQRVTW